MKRTVLLIALAAGFLAAQTPAAAPAEAQAPAAKTEAAAPALCFRELVADLYIGH